MRTKYFIISAIALLALATTTVWSPWNDTDQTSTTTHLSEGGNPYTYTVHRDNDGRIDSVRPLYPAHVFSEGVVRICPRYVGNTLRLPKQFGSKKAASKYGKGCIEYTAPKHTRKKPLRVKLKWVDANGEVVEQTSFSVYRDSF